MANKSKYLSKWTGEQIDDAVGRIIGGQGNVLTTESIVQETGNNVDKVMSQASTTNALSAKQDTLIAGDNISIENNVISAIVPKAIEYTDNVVKNLSLGAIETDNINLQAPLVNLSTGGETANNVQLSGATQTKAGLMTSADVKALSDLQQRVGNLEQKTTRLIYTAKTDPTAEEINTFVTGLGYTTPFSGIAVVVDKTYHIWHYYENDGWKDDGMDTVNIFTNETAGAIKGAGEIAGKVYAENDGTGSVYGWDALNTKVDGKQDKLTAGNNISIENGVIDTKNVFRLDTFSIRYVNSNTDNFRFESGYLTLFSNNKLRFFDASNQYKGSFTPDKLSRAVSGTTYDLTFPDKSGTFALTSDITNAEGITITSPQGTLTTEQLNILKASTENYITINMGGAGSRKLDYYANHIVDNVESRIYSSTIGMTNYTITVNMSTGAYTFSNSNYQDDMSDYYIILSGNSGTLTDEQVKNIENWQQLGKIKQLTHDIWLNFVILDIDSSSGTNVRHLYFTGIKDGIEYDIDCNTTDKTWTLTKKPLQSTLHSGFKLYNDQWIASESQYGAFKQVVTYAHFVNNYNQYTILPLSSSLRMWAECGVGAFEETANDITFYAQTKPTDSLSFNIKHEQVEYSEV